MTSGMICDILVAEKEQRFIRLTENGLITSEYVLLYAASLYKTCCVFAYSTCDARNVEDKNVMGSFLVV